MFQNVWFTVAEGDRIGLIGPNGSGKSTLLQILIGRVRPDSGEIAVRKLARISEVAQESRFTQGETVRSIIERALVAASVPHAEREGRAAETLGRVGFDDFNVDTASLSGGWRKRLAIAEALVQEPDVLLLDEPTNHLDLAGIEWLEGLLQSAPFACVVVSHDRYFLENAATSVVELNRFIPKAFFASRETTAHSWRRKKNFWKRNRSGRRRWKTAYATRSSGCGAVPRHAPRRRRRASTGRRS